MNHIAAQGEVHVFALPSDADMRGDTFAPEAGRLIVGHSETGHHHVIPAGAATAVLVRESEGMRVLRLIVSEPTEITHLREFDTHAPIALAPGNYEVRIAREYDPWAKLARRVAD